MRAESADLFFVLAHDLLRCEGSVDALSSGGGWDDGAAVNIFMHPPPPSSRGGIFFSHIAHVHAQGLV